MRELLPWLRPRQHPRGVAPGLPLARGSGGRHAPHLDRRRFPAPAQPRRPLPGARDGQDLRRAHLRRPARAPELPDLQHLAVLRRLPVVVGASHARVRRLRGDQPRGLARGEAGSEHPGALHRRVPDGVGDRGGDLERRVRRRHDRAAARREPGPRPPLRGRPRHGAASLHLLQQVPVQLRREPARLLRGGRFDSREEMLEQIFSVYGEPSFLAHDTPVEVA